VADDDDMFEEYPVYFVGPCTCDHELEQHGWGECNVATCECEAGWEE